MEQLVDAGPLDELLARVDAGELQLTGEGGFLPVLIKAVLERGLASEHRPGQDEQMAADAAARVSVR